MKNNHGDEINLPEDVVSMVEEIDEIKKEKTLIEGDDYVYKFYLRNCVLVIPSHRMLSWRMFAQRHLEEFNELPPSDLSKPEVWRLFLHVVERKLQCKLRGGNNMKSDIQWMHFLHPRMSHEEVLLNQPEDFDRLTYEEKDILVRWCIDNFIPRKTANKWYTSYGLKHMFEKASCGFYVTNGQFKGAMLVAGYDPVESFCLNWEFRISQKSPAIKNSGWL